MGSCIYLRQWISNMFKYYSQSIQPSVVCFGHFSLILGIYNWIYCPDLTKALMVKDCSYKTSVETLQNSHKKKCQNIQTNSSQLLYFDFYCPKLKHLIFLVLAKKKASFFGRNTSFEGLKSHFIYCTTSLYCPFTNISSLNSKYQSSFKGLKGHFIYCTTSLYCPFTNISSLTSKYQILCHPNFV